MSTVRRCVQKYLEGGTDFALFDKQRKGRPSEITSDAIAWITDIACQRPANLGYSQELWTMANLHKHIQEHAYCSMKLLPYTDKEFEKYQTQSVGEFRFSISEQIREQIIFASSAETFKKGLNTKNVINLLKQKVFGCSSTAQKL